MTMGLFNFLIYIPKSKNAANQKPVFILLYNVQWYICNVDNLKLFRPKTKHHMYDLTPYFFSDLIPSTYFLSLLPCFCKKSRQFEE